MREASILVVDDESGMRDLLSFELGPRGYKVSTAENGLEAVEKMKKQRFDLVISDIKMPGMDGIATLDEIKKIDPMVEVIIVTGYGSIETAVQALKKGAYDFVQKPFNIDALSSLVARALEKSELKTLVALHESSKAVFSTIKLNVLLELVMDLLDKLLKIDEGSLMLLNKEQKLVIVTSRGLTQEVVSRTHLAVGERIAGRVAQERKALLLIDGIKKHEEFREIQGKDRIGSSIIIPLVCGSSLLGVLNLSRLTGREQFTQSDLYKASFFASQLAQALQNAKLYDELELKVNELKEAYKTLEETQNQLVQSEKLVAVGRLIAGVAHEINNPLTAVIGYADLLVNSAELDGQLKQQMTVVFNEAQRCRKIVQDLLIFARRKEPRFQSVGIESIVDQALESMSPQLQKCGVEIREECEASLKVDADPDQLKQVLMNILANAVQALDEVRGRPRRLEIRALKSEELARVTVKDNGPGIPEKHLAKVFDPFFSTKEVGKGTGLGLSISYGIIKDHGGNLHVESKEAEGASFVIELPLRHSRKAGQAAVERAPRAPSAGGLRPEGRHVLVVEDEPSIRGLLTQVLSSTGWGVDTATDGEAAFAALEAKRYDLVLCDYRLPKLNGVSLFKKVKYLHPEMSRCFVFLTGSTADTSLDQFFKENGLLCLYKPFTVEELFSMIERKLAEVGA